MTGGHSRTVSKFASTNDVTIKDLFGNSSSSDAGILDGSSSSEADYGFSPSDDDI